MSDIDIPEGGAMEMHAVDALTAECEQLKRDKAKLLAVLFQIRWEPIEVGQKGQTMLTLTRCQDAARAALAKFKGNS